MPKSVTIEIQPSQELRLLLDGIAGTAGTLAERIGEAVEELGAGHPVALELTAAVDDARSRLAELLP